MPGCHGGDQSDEEYAPHLWYKGKFVGEEKAKELRDRDEKLRKDKIRLLLNKLELQDFDYEKDGYVITDQDPWNIKKEGFKLGIIHEEGYVKIIYEIRCPLEPTVLRQVELAGELATELRNYGCNQLIELPPRNVVVPQLEEIIKYSIEVIRKFKNR